MSALCDDMFSYRECGHAMYVCMYVCMYPLLESYVFELYSFFCLLMFHFSGTFCHLILILLFFIFREYLFSFHNISKNFCDYYGV